MRNILKASLAIAVFAAAMIGMASTPARALVEIDVNKGVVEPTPIAVTDFLSGDSRGAEISGVIAADLRRRR